VIESSAPGDRIFFGRRPARVRLLIQKETDDIIEALRPFFSDDGHIEKVFLFGSRARGDATIRSDADIAVVSFEPEKIDRAKLRRAAEAFGVACDFVYTTPDALDNAVKELDVNYSIRREGVLIWEPE